MDLFILDDNGAPLSIDDPLVWSEWMWRKNERVLKQDEINDIFISTVFLGINLNFNDDGPPILWETMIFGGEHDKYQYCYSSQEQALLGHEHAIKLVKEALENKEDGELVSSWLKRNHPSLN